MQLTNTDAPASSSPAPPLSPAFPPGPPPRSGLVDQLGYYLRISSDPVGFVRDRFRVHGDIYYAPGPDGGLYVLRHPDHLREVLVTRAASFSKTHSSFRQLARVLGDGLLTSDGETWKRHRRMVQPAFGHARLAGYAGIMAEEAARTADAWRDGEVRELTGEMMRLTLRIVSRTLFGHDVSPAATEEVASAMQVIQQSAARPDFLPKWMPSPGRRRLSNAVASLDRILYGMVEARRRTTAVASGGKPDSLPPAGPNGGRPGGAATAGSASSLPPDPAGPPDLLGILLGATDDEGDGARLTEREVRDQLVTLFLAGHETTSHALTWTLYLLARNPSARSRLHAELDEALGGRAPSYDDLPRLPYTEQVLDEAMRMYPPVYAVGRRAHEDTSIGGYPVRAGSEVMLWIYLTHHDPRWFPEPHAFRPERFAPEEAAKLPKQAHLPFGAGPRACIGKVFAMMEARLILATLGQRFRLELLPGQRATPRLRITMYPKEGMPMRLHARAR